MKNENESSNNFDHQNYLKELLTNLEHYQEKVAAMQDAIAVYKAAMEDTKGILKTEISRATMNGELILNQGRWPYLMSGYVVMIDFRTDGVGGGIISNMEVTEVQVIDV